MKLTSSTTAGGTKTGRDAPGRAIPLKNIMDADHTLVDSLHCRSMQQKTKQTSCTGHTCLGALMMDAAGFPNTQPKSREDTLEEADDFLRQYFTASKKLDLPLYEKRKQEVLASIEKNGSYDMTYEELVFATKTAWRNASRCIGRIQWNKLEVFDCRHVKTAQEMFDSLLRHIKYSTNGGNLRSAITVFPARRPGTIENDFKVWNSVLIGYAGYQQPDGSVIGDPKAVEITEIAQKLGWKGKGGRFDVLPLILQANGDDPEYFDIPPEYILEVNITHPKYPKFGKLGLKWFAVPAVANMLSDLGGVEFTATPFSGWYMSTEIATRDLCDSGRYNVLKEAADAFDIPVGGNTTLWKDKVLVEVNMAVLESFNKCGVTITDHHSASESFMKHMQNEQKLRGGCPADWVWIVPPMSGSLMQVFHQEMVNYKLKPSYEYQESPWRVHKWKSQKYIDLFWRAKHFTFKAVSKAVLFASIIARGIAAKRTRCTILFATETGRSEAFSARLLHVFSHAFNARVMCMEDYDPQELAREKLLLAVASTTGNGDAPANGQEFQKTVSELQRKLQSVGQVVMKSEKPNKSSYLCCCQWKKSKVGSYELAYPKSLSNTRFSVFGLGSKAYPHFCKFAHTVDELLTDLGASCLYPIGEGCELEGQEEPFDAWAADVFKEACKEFDVDEVTMKTGIAVLGGADKSWKPGKFQIVHTEDAATDIVEGLNTLHGKVVKKCKLKKRQNLQSQSSETNTILVCLEHDQSKHFEYSPGDHVAVFPANDVTVVQNIINKVTECPAKHQTFTLEINQDLDDGRAAWTPFSRLPAADIERALTHYLDITTPPSQQLLAQLVHLAQEEKDKEKLQLLSKNSKEYQKWKNYHWPNIGEMFDLFPSLRVPASVLLTQLPILQHRYYSISSSADKFTNQIHITLSVVTYRTQGGKGPQHKGVCTNYLNELPEGSEVKCFLRSASDFHLPSDIKAPVIMVGPGTGIAPFRSFWQQRQLERSQNPDKQFGPMYLYFGCRTTDDDLFGTETKECEKEGVITKVYTALSRQPNQPKKYVQNYLMENQKEVHNLITSRGGHLFVCGSVSMAQGVHDTVKEILCGIGNMSSENAQNYLASLKSEQRYHQDIFGAGFQGSGQTDTS